MGGRPDDGDECRGEDHPLGDAGTLCARDLECTLEEDLSLLGDSTLIDRFEDLRSDECFEDLDADVRLEDVWLESRSNDLWCSDECFWGLEFDFLRRCSDPVALLCRTGDMDFDRRRSIFLDFLLLRWSDPLTRRRSSKLRLLLLKFFMDLDFRLFLETLLLPAVSLDES